MDNFELVKRQIHKQGQEFQGVIDQFREELSSEQAARYLLTFLQASPDLAEEKQKLLFKRKSSDLTIKLEENMEDAQQLIQKKIHLENT